MSTVHKTMNILNLTDEEANGCYSAPQGAYGSGAAGHTEIDLLTNCVYGFILNKPPVSDLPEQDVPLSDRVDCPSSSPIAGPSASPVVDPSGSPIVGPSASPTENSSPSLSDVSPSDRIASASASAFASAASSSGPTPYSMSTPYSHLSSSQLSSSQLSSDYSSATATPSVERGLERTLSQAFLGNFQSPALGNFESPGGEVAAINEAASNAVLAPPKLMHRTLSESINAAPSESIIAPPSGSIDPHLHARSVSAPGAASAPAFPDVIVGVGSDEPINILIVEDSSISQRILQVSLTKAAKTLNTNFRLVRALSGEEAVEKCQKRVADKLPNFPIVFMDTNLGSVMDGLAVTGRIIALYGYGREGITVFSISDGKVEGGGNSMEARVECGMSTYCLPKGQQGAENIIKAFQHEKVVAMDDSSGKVGVSKEWIAKCKATTPHTQV